MEHWNVEPDIMALAKGILLVDEGVLQFRGRWYVSGGLTEADVDETLDCANRVMGKL